MEAFTPSTSQRERLARSAAILDARRVPRFKGPLYTSDDAEVTLRSPQDTARRALVVWAVALRADGMPQREALEMLDQPKLWPSVSPDEARYIRDPNPDPDETASLVWRLEAQWVLMWALGRVDELGWPASMCDVPHLVEVMKPVEADPGFIEATQLRSKREILDAQDLTMRLHWATRDAWLAKRLIRSDLDWTAGQPDVPVTHSPAVGVIEQRHKTLNWLVRFGEADWDDVDTPT
jgi:hypothetical protein